MQDRKVRVDVAQDSSTASKCRLGIVLEGGGAKGAFSFGVLETLLASEPFRQRFDIAGVSGTSVGALNGALHAYAAMDRGRELWSTISFDGVYPLRRPRRFFAAIAPLVLSASCWMHNLNHRELPRDLRHISLLMSLLLMSPTLIAGTIAIGGYRYLLLLIFAVVVFCQQFADPGRRILNVHIVGLLLVAPGMWAFRFGQYLFYSGSAAEVRAWSYGLVVELAVIALHICAIILSNVTILDNKPLRNTIGRVLLGRQIRCPLFATFAYDEALFDPESPTVTSSVMGRDHVGPMDFYVFGRPTWVPEYRDVSRVPVTEQVNLLLASAALPYSLVPGVAVEGKDVEAVDGGVADNIPVWPLLEHVHCDAVMILRVNSSQSWCPKDHWRQVDRLQQLRQQQDRFPVGSTWSSQEWYSAGTNSMPGRVIKEAPRIRVKPRERSEFPAFYTISPSINLGGLFTGTLNFHPRYAVRLMQEGRDVAHAWLRSEGLELP